MAPGLRTQLVVLRRPPVPAEQPDQQSVLWMLLLSLTQFPLLSLPCKGFDPRSAAAALLADTPTPAPSAHPWALNSLVRLGGPLSNTLVTLALTMRPFCHKGVRGVASRALARLMK